MASNRDCLLWREENISLVSDLSIPRPHRNTTKEILTILLYRLPKQIFSSQYNAWHILRVTVCWINIHNEREKSKRHSQWGINLLVSQSFVRRLAQRARLTHLLPSVRTIPTHPTTLLSLGVPLPYWRILPSLLLYCNCCSSGLACLDATFLHSTHSILGTISPVPVISIPKKCWWILNL